jgi:hypothetical protein
LPCLSRDATVSEMREARTTRSDAPSSAVAAAAPISPLAPITRTGCGLVVRCCHEPNVGRAKLYCKDEYRHISIAATYI